MRKVTVAQLIASIEQRQPVMNKAALNDASLQTLISGVSALDSAQAGELSFLANKRYSDALASTEASVILVDPAHQDNAPQSCTVLVVASPYLAYACVSQWFDQGFAGPSLNAQAADVKSDWSSARPTATTSIHPNATIHSTAVIESDVSVAEDVVIGAYCVIGAGSCIGRGTQLASHVAIGSNVMVGQDCVIYPQVVIGHDCQIGDQVRIHANASIGSEGFGFAPTPDPAVTGWERIAQLGRVIIGDQVRIGSQTCIDRGAIDDTVIGDHVIIDNLVQIAHNVQIGAGTAIAANTGIAGSTKIGKRCIIGGAVGISGHIEITDDVTITAMTMVTKSIKQPGSYSSGTVAMPTAKWRKAAVRFRQVK